MPGLRCVMCGDPVLGAPRWETRLCSGQCATEALFEAVRLEGELERSSSRAQALEDPADPGDRARALLADFRLLHRRSELLRATVAWHELADPVESVDVAGPLSAPGAHG